MTPTAALSANRRVIDRQVTHSLASPDDSRAAGFWLAAFAVMVFVMILVGGATRLTESGLSITEWNPVSGVIPPLTDAQWEAALAKYRQIPQYQQLNAGMSLGAFKQIYLWEYGHRLAARLVGLAFVVPLAWFAVRRRLPRFALRRSYLLLAMLLGQAAMGWWMVSSGLSGRTEVSQYRLAAHLLFAFAMLALTVWTAADLLEGRRQRAATGGRSRLLPMLAGLVFITSGTGALVAGLRAGRIFNTFPLMAGSIVPPGYTQLAPGWINSFENPAAVQFNHRVLAVLTVVAVLAAWALIRERGNARLVRRMHLVAGMAVLQLVLGIATLLLAVPITLGVAHQGGAALLLCAVVLAWHADETTAAR
ncbi:MAG: COX15/CtaA family protein [Gemmatimonadaceae bacterium]|nr:COX15/CtaA family protein [Gemmatimonadaceae bacterium]